MCFYITTLIGIKVKGMVLLLYFNQTPLVMTKDVLKAGDIVVLISDSRVKYTITSLYGNGNAYCSYYDEREDRIAELSIPLVALTLHKKKAETTFVHLPDTVITPHRGYAA